MISHSCALAWNDLTCLDYLYGLCAHKEGRRVLLILLNLLVREAIIANEEVDLIFLRREPLDVALALLIVLKALVRLSIVFQPISVIQDSLGLENFLRVPRHVNHHLIIGEIILISNCKLTLLLCANRVDVCMFKHATGVFAGERAGEAIVVFLTVTVCLCTNHFRVYFSKSSILSLSSEEHKTVQFIGAPASIMSFINA